MSDIYDVSGGDGMTERAEAIKKVKAVQVHLYPLRNVLNPRGTNLSKESLGEVIYEHLVSTFEHWTDPKYGDNPVVDDLILQMHVNFHRETMCAWANLLAKWAPPKESDDVH